MLLIFARIFVVIFAVLVTVKSYLSYKEKKESLTMTVFWTLTWLFICVVTFFPQYVDQALGSPKAKGGVGTILGIGLIFIYFVIYRVYVKAHRIEKHLHKIIREIALKYSDIKPSRKTRKKTAR